MDYDVVIATRNRPEALRISIPLILNQSRAPKKLIVIDASDEYERVNRTVTEVMADSPVQLEIIHSKPNLPQQRNIGLKYVQSPVVMFPDDDSLWWPGVAEAIMRVYERDEAGVIGGVSATGTRTYPVHDTNWTAENGYAMRRADFLAHQFNRVRRIFDDRICPDPIWILGKQLSDIHPVPEWLGEVGASVISFIAGWRMSFRTDAVRGPGFNSDLGIYVGWAACEDGDICFGVMAERLLVVASAAKVYHLKHPSRRAGGFQHGFILMFNKAYVICRYSPPGSRARKALKRFGCYKAMQYLLGTKSKFGRDRVRGHLQALRAMNVLLDSPAENLRDRYLQQCQKVLAK